MGEILSEEEIDALMGAVSDGDDGDDGDVDDDLRPPPLRDIALCSMPGGLEQLCRGCRRDYRQYALAEGEARLWFYPDKGAAACRSFESDLWL